VWELRDIDELKSKPAFKDLVKAVDVLLSKCSDA
jgi:hypothetical protein